ncbi:pentapeptide repeat-containing protein [Pseudomonas japonica]|uniref:pentapeptide repeat-containing protein n=1 Tax=Pseudomonas japonica TaxID=256466 RepID=UPI0015E331B0|nr:pentapeptide repeat-containing protein [Pseudomonas japonica]MBA1245320.1 pentapeptide repeat-containing protein [Pseudomonas japonica]MBA1291047.1 pentapeptide repeat-containing protein [Pseudomonas japonica]
MTQPKLIDSPLFALVREERIGDFNEAKRREGAVDFTGGDFRGLDLRNLDADGLNLSDAYFRSADLRGIDFRNACLEGASLAHAQISGAYFPPELSADEILMSVNFGTRLRYRTK